MTRYTIVRKTIGGSTDDGARIVMPGCREDTIEADGFYDHGGGVEGGAFSRVSFWRMTSSLSGYDDNRRVIAHYTHVYSVEEEASS